MSDNVPSDAVGLRALEAELTTRLALVRAALAEAESRPYWWVQRMRRGERARAPRGYLHRAGCWMPGEPTLSRAAAVAALADPRIAYCTACKPEQGLRGHLHVALSVPSGPHR
ncbi:DUF6233 domain-containing protein [Streptomyces botrytidirepellens]|uniref:DUF6233 domain-containing protein n=1 Tax=Streptomyces botrytidirepellens TaxID=2486417 RepID=UPI003CCC6B66